MAGKELGGKEEKISVQGKYLAATAQDGPRRSRAARRRGGLLEVEVALFLAFVLRPRANLFSSIFHVRN